MATHDFLIIGAGIFGITTAVELAKRKYSVAILDPGPIPHPLAASTDISKVVRMEYGSDVEYMDMVIECIDGWKAWNEHFGETLYHECGFLVLSAEALESNAQSFENSSYKNLFNKGLRPDRLNSILIDELFPAFNSQHYTDGFFHAIGGFAESGQVVSRLTAYARQLGVDVYENTTAEKLVVSAGKMEAVETREGSRFEAGHVIVCAGNFTQYLLPELQPYMKVTGHPVFHLKPSQPELFRYPHFAAFGADISKTGWYGFPLHPKAGVVKIANHGVGQELHPTHDERIVTEADISHLRAFLKQSIPSLADDPIVYTRLCCYTDTLDGHFWIDNHPDIKGLTVGSGGSGHGLKMAPVIGDMIATVAEGGSHKLSARHRWRELMKGTVQEEEARFKEF